MNGYLPLIVMGHAAVPLPAGPTTAAYEEQPISLKAYMEGKSLSYYLSNVPHERHQHLSPPKPHSDQKLDHFETVIKILTAAQREYPPDAFQAGLSLVATRFWPQDELSSALAGIQRLQVTSSRSISPGKRKKDSPETTPRVQHQRRAASLEQELEEAQKDLNYTYSEPMEFSSENSAEDSS
jgi:hypothetical protein